MNQKLLTLAVVAVLFVIVPDRLFGQAKENSQSKSAIQAILDSLPNDAFLKSMANSGISHPDVQGDSERGPLNAEVFDLVNTAVSSLKDEDTDTWHRALRNQRKQFEDISSLLGVGEPQTRDAALMKDMILEFSTATILKSKKASKASREETATENERLDKELNVKRTKRLATAKVREASILKHEKYLSEKFGVSKAELRGMKDDADDWYAEFKRSRKRVSE